MKRGQWIKNNLAQKPARAGFSLLGAKVRIGGIDVDFFVA